MSLNLTNKTSYHQFDEHGMLCIPSDQSWEKRSWWKKLWDKILKRVWIPTWSNKSWRDSIGRTVLAWIAYGRPKELAKSLDNCMDLNRKKYKWEVYRHPNHKELSSRDHWSYMLIHLKLYNPHWLIHAVKGKFIPRMRGMNLWTKALTGNRRAEWWYYTLGISGALLGNWWLRKCRKWGGIQPERDNHWWIKKGCQEWVTLGNCYLHNLSRWQKLWAWIIFTSMPAYALHNKAWQIYVMPASRKKEKLKRILLSRIGISNIMLRLLLGDTTVTQEEVDNYPRMTGYRPGVYLDESCRRDIRELTDEEAEFNTYEKDLIIWLWKQFIMK